MTPLDELRAWLGNRLEADAASQVRLYQLLQQLRQMALPELGTRLVKPSTPLVLKRLILGLTAKFDWPEWVPWLLQALQQEPDLGVFDEGCAALGRLEIRSAREALQKLAALRTDPEQSPDLYVFDYVQQLDPGDGPSGENMATRIGRITGRLKELAMETKTPVLAAAQLNRESAKEGEPQLHHLRDSGAIEQDADRVVMMQMSSVTPPDQPTAELNVFQRKNRNGPIGDITLAFDRRTTRFANHTR